jgi:hypothetical protein
MLFKKTVRIYSCLVTSPPGPLSTRGEGETRGLEVPSPYLERGFRGEVNKGEYPCSILNLHKRSGYKDLEVC